jgi:membrane protein DedA with SNARE-associated domain
VPEWVISWLEGWPFVWIYLFFVLGAALRSQSLYWLGRGVTAGVVRTRWRHLLEGERTVRAISAVERWGMPIVPLSFLTVGFQSAVHGACGLLRLRWLRYTLWAVPGWLVWALVWSLVVVGGSIAAVWAGARLAARSPWALVGAVVLLAVGAALVVRAVRRRSAGHAAHEVAQA